MFGACSILFHSFGVDCFHSIKRGRRYAEIALRVWGEENAGSELIWVHISALRGKLAQIEAQAKIRTYRGQGYALEI